MRRTQPDAATFILTGYPAFETALEAIRQQVDDYLVKPTDTAELVQKIKTRLSQRRTGERVETKRLPVVILDTRESIIEGWLAALKNDPELSALNISDSDRLDGVPEVLEIAVRLSQGTT